MSVTLWSLKKTHMHKWIAKANHLAYLGDTEIGAQKQTSAQARSSATLTG